MEYSFSIVIPVYNAEKYIREMIESIIGQTYTRWNLILIDDGSTDLSGSICDEYVSDNIQIYHNSNQGQSMARRCGISKASGDYTIVMDADDYITRDCLETLNRILNIEEYDIVMFPYEYCDERLNSTGGLCTFPSKIGKLDKLETLQWVIKTGNHGLVNKAVKTEILKKAIADVPLKRIKVNGDYILIIPILCACDSFYFVDKIMYKYRIYTGSISHNYTFQHLIDTDFVSNEVFKVLNQNKINQEQLSILVVDAYEHMIVNMLERYLEKSDVSYDDLIQLNEQPFFKLSSKYEKNINLDFYESRLLNAMRRQSITQINALSVFYPIEKIKNRIVHFITKQRKMR